MRKEEERGDLLKDIAKAMQDAPKEVLEDMAKAMMAEVEKWKSKDAGKVASPRPMRIVEIGDEITVKQLAERIGVTLSTLLIVLIPMKIPEAHADMVLSFEVAVEVGRRVGIEVRRAGEV